MAAPLGGRRNRRGGELPRVLSGCATALATFTLKVDTLFVPVTCPRHLSQITQPGNNGYLSLPQHKNVVDLHLQPAGSREPWLVAGFMGAASGFMGAASVMTWKRVRVGCCAVWGTDGKTKRRIHVGGEASFATEFPTATVSSMDAFMQEHALHVLKGATDSEGVEQVPDKPTLYYFFQPYDMGPFHYQLRTEVRLDLPSSQSGRVGIEVLGMEIGSVDKKTGAVNFDSGFTKLETSAENFICWEPCENGALHVECRGKSFSFINLPWWFPLPDGVASKTLNLLVRQQIQSSVNRLRKELESTYMSWAAVKT